MLWGGEVWYPRPDSNRVSESLMLGLGSSSSATTGAGAVDSDASGTTRSSDYGASGPDQSGDIKSPVAMRKRNRTPRMTPAAVTAI